MDPLQPDRRGARRYELELVVTVDGARCESKNLSSTGLFVLSDRAFQPGVDVPLEVFFPELPGQMKRVNSRSEIAHSDVRSGHAQSQFTRSLGLETDDLVPRAVLEPLDQPARGARDAGRARAGERGDVEADSHGRAR